MDFPNRIMQILTSLGMNQSAFANKLGVSRGIISEFTSGSREPSKDFLFGLSKLGISLDWFLTGEGEMFVNAKASADDHTLETTETKIPLLLQRTSCGVGQEWSADDCIDKYIEPLHLVTTISRKHIYAIYASGLSMIGAGINDGDILFFDGRQGQSVKDDIYIFALDGLIACKLLKFEPLKNEVQIFSMHEEKPQKAELIKIVNPDSPSFKILGRVLCWMHENRLMSRHEGKK